METPTICCRTGPVAGPCSQSWMPSHTPFLSSPFAGSIPVSLSSLPLLPAVGSTVPSLHLLPTSQHTIVSTSVMSTGIMATQSGMEKPSPFSLASSFRLSQTKWSRKSKRWSSWRCGSYSWTTGSSRTSGGTQSHC